MVILLCEHLWFLQDVIRSENPSLEREYETYATWSWNFCKIKHGNPVIGIISSQIVFCDKCNMDNCLICVFIAVGYYSNWITTCFFKTRLVDCLSLSWSILICWWWKPSGIFPSCVLSSSFAFFFNPTVLFLPQESFDHTGAMFPNKWAPL